MQNDIRKREQKQSERWVAELVNHMGLYDLRERRREKKIKNEKEEISVGVDDVIYSGGNYAYLNTILH